MSLLKLTDQVIVITGAASGIGRYLVETCLQQGAYVAGLDLNPLPYQHERLTEFTLDISSEEQVRKTIQNVHEKYKKIHALINNAGIQIISELIEFDYSNWKKMFAIHVEGSFLLAQECMKIMKNVDGVKSIINMGSIHSFEASKNKSAYVAAKHALLGLTRSLASEGAAYNIKANLVAPGFVKTPMVEKQIPEQAKTLNISEEEVVKRIMLGKTVDGQFTTVEEITEAVLFFMQYPTLAVTGQSLLVSHGQNMM